MGHVPTPSLPPATPLFWLADRLYVLYQWWDWLAGQISGVWLLKDYLAGPFKTIGAIFKECSNRCNQADSYVANLFIWVDGIVNGTVFLQLLNWASGHFDLIRNNAWDWVKLIIAGMGYYYALFIASPLQFVNQLIRQVAPHISQFLDNPLEFIRSQVILLNSWIFYFLYYPANFIIGKLNENFWWLASFLNNPWFFITETVRLLFPELYSIYLNPSDWWLGKLQAISNDLYLIFVDSSLFFKRKFEEITKFGPSFWNNPIGYLVNFGLGYLDAEIDLFADIVKSIAIKIILKYI